MERKTRPYIVRSDRNLDQLSGIVPTVARELIRLCDQKVVARIQTDNGEMGLFGWM
jgi:hypothetical protein